MISNNTFKFIFLLSLLILTVSEFSNAQCTADFTTSPASLTGCSPFEIEFIDNSSNNVIERTWIFGDGTTLPVKVNPKHTFTSLDSLTSYTVMLVIKCTGGEKDTSITQVNVKKGVSVTASNGATICVGESSQLSASGSESGSYIWAPSTGLDNATIENPTATPTDTTSYVVTFSNGECSNTDTVVIQVDPCLSVLENPIPQVFSPNGDGVNETWKIDGIQHFENNSIIIFNQWGGQVYIKAGYKNDWRGTDVNEKNELPDGVYYYVVKLGNGTDPYTGYLVIQR